MNERYEQLLAQAHIEFAPNAKAVTKRFAELIVEECRTVIVELYHKTSLELCGPLLTADEKIAEHFYGVTEE